MGARRARGRAVQLGGRPPSARSARRCGPRPGCTVIVAACTEADVERPRRLPTSTSSPSRRRSNCCGCVGLAWQRGWQPSELARHARRQGRPARADRRRPDPRRRSIERDPSTIHPQLVPSRSRRSASSDSRLLVGWATSSSTKPSDRRRAAAAWSSPALALLAHLGDLPTILPPPGTDPSTWNRRDDGRATDDPVLAKVRALLAQAESTTFEAEAEAFTAKAQELMARHAIDAALLWARSGRDRTAR